MVPERDPSADLGARLRALSGRLGGLEKYYPQAKIITYGNSLPASAPLIEALAHVKAPDGKVTDYTKLVDDPTTGHLLPGMAAAVAGRPS